MNHKISEFCDKIDSIKKMSDRLRDMKYGPLGASIREIDEMIETILDYWQEGWYDGDQSDVVDELRGLHNGSEKPLDLWSDSDIINEYERAVEFLEELQDIENG